MDKKQKAIMIGGAASAVVAGLAPAALASTNVGPVELSATGVTFGGFYGFYEAGAVTHGGFSYNGGLCDTAQDGNGVFVHGKVEGYAYGTKYRNSGGVGTCKDVASPIMWDPQATFTYTGRVQTCQDRGTWIPDLCDAETYYRGYC